MRIHNFNRIDNASMNTLRDQRDFIQKEIYKNGGLDALSVSRLRNGLNNFGSCQMMGIDHSSDSAIVGMSMGSTIVG